MLNAARLLFLAQHKSSNGEHAAALECVLQAHTSQPQMLTKGALVAEARLVSAAEREQLLRRLLQRRADGNNSSGVNWDHVVATFNELLSKVGPSKEMPQNEMVSRRQGNGWLPQSAVDQLRLDEFVLNNSFPGRPSPGGRAVDVAQKVLRAFVKAFMEFADDTGVVNASKLVLIGKSAKFEEAAHMSGYLQVIMRPEWALY